MTNRYVIPATVLALAASIGTGPAHASDAACKPVFDAKAKQTTTPNHQYMTETAATHAAPEKSEIIFTSTAMYINVDGTWQRRAFDAQKELADLRDAARASHTTCRYLRDEAVGSEAAAVYATRDEQEGGTHLDSQLWISKSRGLPLKQTIDVDVGGKFGKSHQEARIDYANVQAPAGVR
ncbi:MAG: hypothetical protein ABI178_06545 [Rhodanobacter sp.]